MYIAGRLRTDILLPFFVTAIPAAFVGGMIDAPRRLFLAVLAVGLTLAAAAMLKTAAGPDDPSAPSKFRLWAVAIPAGSAIGLASGFLGIGGGIFLGPLILLLGWASVREVAAINSATVLILSIAGLAAHGLRGAVDLQIALPLGIAVLIGGVAGAHLAETKLSAAAIKRLFAVIVLIAAVRAAISAFS